MLRKGEQCSPTDVCHVHDINVRCYVKAWGAQCALEPWKNKEIIAGYVKAWGAQCAPLCSRQNF